MPEEPIIGGSEPREVMPTRYARDWSQIKTAEDAAAAMQKEYGGVVSSRELRGNEFDLLAKAALIGVPFLILEFGFSESDRYGTGKEYAWVRGMRMDNQEMVAFSDGSTGIYSQLRDLADRTDRYGGIVCRNGLRVSRYDYEDKETGEIIRDAETYYIDS